eukprot:3179087-Pyramimonas_sp.AAC.1
MPSRSWAGASSAGAAGAGAGAAAPAPAGAALAVLRAIVSRWCPLFSELTVATPLDHESELQTK